MKGNNWKKTVQGMELTPEVAAALVAEQCRLDPKLAQRLRDNPRDCLQKLGNHKLLENIKIAIHDNTDDTWHLPLPRYSQDHKLTEEQLDKLVAGESAILAGAIIVGGGSAVLAGVLAGFIGYMVSSSQIK